MRAEENLREMRQVSNMMFANDDVVWITWQHSEVSLVPTLKHANDVIANFVTASASIHL
jgi:cell division GTPase FtsZ